MQPVTATQNVNLTSTSVLPQQHMNKTLIADAYKTKRNYKNNTKT